MLVGVVGASSRSEAGRKEAKDGGFTAPDVRLQKQSVSPSTDGPDQRENGEFRRSWVVHWVWPEAGPQGCGERGARSTA